jgi:hypothetical protein
MGHYLVLAASCILAVGCFEQEGNGPATRPDDDLDVYEAVFRYRLREKPADFKAYLSVEGKDPPAALLKRLVKDWPNLKPASEEPKEKGHRLYAEGLKRGARGEAELKAGYWFPTRFAGEGYFADHHLVREKGKWVVKKVTNETSS